MSLSDITAAGNPPPSPPDVAPEEAAGAPAPSNGMDPSPADVTGGGESAAAKADNGPPKEPEVDPAVAALCAPVDESDPCGPDLDLESDADYINFMVAAEGVLPTSFFVANDSGKPFFTAQDDQSVAARAAIPDQLAALKPLLQRTRDLRLLTILARMSILNRDLEGFATALAATAECCNRYWDGIHPRVTSGDLDMRVGVLATLDLPTVVFPLQYAPLVEVPRQSALTYRGWMIATGETKPRAGEQKQTTDAISTVIATADSAALARTRRQITVIKASLDRIFNAFLSRGTSVGLENIRSLVDRIVTFIIPPSSDVGEVADGAAGAEAGDASGPAAAVGPVRSLAQAKHALGAIAKYYTRSEPSSPALPLVSQAHQLIGKSFFEVMSILVPNHIEKAAFQVGSDQIFELPVGRTSKAVGDGAAGAAQEADGDAGGPIKVETRSQAMALLEEVQRYFRTAEPSSPVPMLCERARALAGRDFMSVLKEVLPKAALKNATGEK